MPKLKYNNSEELMAIPMLYMPRLNGSMHMNSKNMKFTLLNNREKVEKLKDIYTESKIENKITNVTLSLKWLKKKPKIDNKIQDRFIRKRRNLYVKRLNLKPSLTNGLLMKIGNRQGVRTMFDKLTDEAKMDNKPESVYDQDLLLKNVDEIKMILEKTESISNTVLVNKEFMIMEYYQRINDRLNDNSSVEKIKDSTSVLKNRGYNWFLMREIYEQIILTDIKGTIDIGAEYEFNKQNVVYEYKCLRTTEEKVDFDRIMKFAFDSDQITNEDFKYFIKNSNLLLDNINDLKSRIEDKLTEMKASKISFIRLVDILNEINSEENFKTMKRLIKNGDKQKIDSLLVRDAELTRLESQGLIKMMYNKQLMRYKPKFPDDKMKFNYKDYEKERKDLLRFTDECVNLMKLVKRDGISENVLERCESLLNKSLDLISDARQAILIIYLKCCVEMNQYITVDELMRKVGKGNMRVYNDRFDGFINENIIGYSTDKLIYLVNIEDDTQINKAEHVFGMENLEIKLANTTFSNEEQIIVYITNEGKNYRFKTTSCDVILNSISDLYTQYIMLIKVEDDVKKLLNTRPNEFYGCNIIEPEIERDGYMCKKSKKRDISSEYYIEGYVLYVEDPTSRLFKMNCFLKSEFSEEEDVEFLTIEDCKILESDGTSAIIMTTETDVGIGAIGDRLILNNFAEVMETTPIITRCVVKANRDNTVNVYYKLKNFNLRDKKEQINIFKFMSLNEDITKIKLSIEDEGKLKDFFHNITPIDDDMLKLLSLNEEENCKTIYFKNELCFLALPAYYFMVCKTLDRRMADFIRTMFKYYNNFSNTEKNSEVLWRTYCNSIIGLIESDEADDMIILRRCFNLSRNLLNHISIL